MACPGRPQLYSPNGTPYTTRYTSDGRCLDVPAWTPLGQGATIYGRGGFASANPNAITAISYRDAEGKQYLNLGTASRGLLGTICTANCGKGTGFLGLGGRAADIGRVVANLASQVAIRASPIGPIYSAAAALAENVERSQSGMSLNLSGILGAAGSIISGANFGSYDWLGNLAGAGLQISGAALAPQPTAIAAPAPMYGPIYSPPPVSSGLPQTAPTPTMSTAPFVRAAGAIAAVTAPILAKIAMKLGLRARPSLSRAMDMVRKAAKLLQSPEAVAAALGITVAELATLITSSNARKRRRMNPANSKALRRAARRIKSFHRLCTHTDVLRGRGRGASRRSSCGTCKKSPCRC